MFCYHFGAFITGCGARQSEAGRPDGEFLPRHLCREAPHALEGMPVMISSSILPPLYFLTLLQQRRGPWGFGGWLFPPSRSRSILQVRSLAFPDAPARVGARVAPSVPAAFGWSPPHSWLRIPCRCGGRDLSRGSSPEPEPGLPWEVSATHRRETEARGRCARFPPLRCYLAMKPDCSPVWL